ncbi:MAG: FlgD immunoglobulin-like domain containing protein [bacterium]
METTISSPKHFNPETVIEYQTRLDGPVELIVYNLSGKKVRELVNGVRPAGNYEARWNGTDDWGNRVSSGMYIYRLKSGNFMQAKKMVLLQ